MALSKRLRYEILRRDNHACRYCGATAPDAKLTVDHVVPTALGGTDEPTNLAAACAACNAGKSASAADSSVVADVSADVIRWREALVTSAIGAACERDERDAHRAAFLERWNTWTLRGEPFPLPNEWPLTIDRFVENLLHDDDIADAIDVSMRQPWARDEWRYFCGVCWGMIQRRQNEARNFLTYQDQKVSR